MDEESIFVKAIEFHNVEKRNVFLDQACENNPGLRHRVENLIISHKQTASFLDEPAGLNLQREDLITEKIGTVIGPYKLREVLGDGGMGVVYAAEQDQPVRRKVAVKIIKPGMDSREVIRRFESERQAIAMMDHPNIASVLDAGATEKGHPFFVMELIRGVSITEYCDKQKCSIGDRLEMFVRVCRAVQHAHQKGIIHRDLKPGNVMVTLHDGVPVPKVIDFGVAKAIDHRLSDGTVCTKVSQIVGTPMYMSPEQAELSGLDIDTRTDIYSLGVILYELLTGSTPFTHKEFSSVGFDEVRRIIRENEPPRPSDRISTIDAEAASTISTNRVHDRRKLIRTLRGDLDWIVMKALEKDRTRRYETAGDFAKDIVRFLHDDAVLARPPSAAYKARKFVKKNRVAVATAAGMATLLIAGIAVSSWFAFQANLSRNNETVAKQDAIDQRDAANERLDLAIAAVENYYTGITEDIILKEPGFKHLRNKLLKQPAHFFEQLNDQLQNDSTPEGRFRLARANQSLFEIQTDFGENEDATRSLRTAIELLETLVQEDPDNTRYLRAIVKCKCHRIVLFEKDNELAVLEGAPPELVQMTADTTKHAVRLLDLLPNDHSAMALKLNVHVHNATVRDEVDLVGQREHIDEATVLLDRLDFDKIKDPGDRHDAIGACSLLAFPVLHDLREFKEADDILTRLITYLEQNENDETIQSWYSNMYAEMLDCRLMVRRVVDPEYDSLSDYQQIYKLRKAALDTDPNALIVKQGAGTAAYSIARRYEERSAMKKALEWADKANKLFAEILDVDPNRLPVIMLDQMNDQLRGDVLMAMQNYEQAIVAFESAGEIDNYHGSATANPNDAKIVYARAHLGQSDVVFERACKLSAELDPPHSVVLAQALAICAENIQDEQELEQFQRKAIELLKHAFTQPYPDSQMQIFRNALRHNPNFDSLRDLEDFSAILAKVE